MRGGGNLSCSAYERLFRRGIGSSLFFLFLWGTAHSLTRWSSVQFVPDADLLQGGTAVISAQGYYYEDTEKGNRILPLAFVNYGIIEWVNFEAGYAGGPSFGLKARILGETRPWMPSLAIGARNIFTHREAYLFDTLNDSMGSEFYLVCGKNVDVARLRFHLGVQSIPDYAKEQVSVFAALEKYFGMGMYVSIEAYMREEKIHPSLFASWRFFKKRVELSAGLFDITAMFIDRKDVPSGSAFYASSSAQFVRPGIWVGLRFNGGLKIGRSGGFTGIENSLNDQSTSIQSLRSEVDSLKKMLKRSTGSIETLNKTVSKMNDSTLTDEQRYKAIAMDKLALLGSLYTAEPFEPDAVKNAMAELIANRDRMLPALYDIIIDPVQENRIRTLAITALGEIGTPAAADVVIGILGQSTIPELTIECLIELGKMKETRAVYLMQQLANDPNDDVAFTAAEVLQKLEKETGVSISPVAKANTAPVSIPEKSIGGTDKPLSLPMEPTKNEKKKAAIIASENTTGMSKIEKPEFIEATVTTDSTKKTKKEQTEKLTESPDSKPIPPASIQPAIIPPDEKKDVIVPQAADSSVVKTQPSESAIVSEKNENSVKPADTRKKISAQKKTKSKKQKQVDTSDTSW
jgi:hypothetical protein